MNKFGFVRITTVSPIVHVANPDKNVEEMISVVFDAEDDIIVFPELAVTGYSCANLFNQETLLSSAYNALDTLAAHVPATTLVIAGCPIKQGNFLYNCAVVMQHGRIIGIVPKQHIPTYKEFYEGRWFKPADGYEAKAVDINNSVVPFGVDLLFTTPQGVKVGIEICEDLWVPVPPSSYQAIAGANVMLNISASPETVGKSRYRTELVVGQSARTMGVYAYCCAGTSESTTDVVMSGHNIIAENGKLLSQSEVLQWGKTISITADVDIEAIQNDRREQMHNQQRLLPWKYREIVFNLKVNLYAKKLKRFVDGTPFIPRDPDTLANRCRDINNITSLGLARRLETLPADTSVWFGVSGGADSTKVALDIRKAFQHLGRPLSLVNGVTMPGFGTHDRTKTNALDLIHGLGFTSHNWDIRPICMEVFEAIGHKPFGLDLPPKVITVDGVAHPISDYLDIQTRIRMFQERLQDVPKDKLIDLIFENVQARVRTLLLMSRGFVVGTGDLTEAALGWCTYNGDHMSMYNPNCSVPKSLVCFLIEYAANTDFKEDPVRDTLLSIASTVISPELLPTVDGEIRQSTEDILGPFLLHDFVLYCNVRNGYSPEKIRYLMDQAVFPQEYTAEIKNKVIRIHFDRFLSNQFKRSAAPDGPKVGSVSLSQRGDWRQPSDVDSTIWRVIAQTQKAG
jgi:NAD+ synthase (glutamine-hydrolysing)